MKSRAKLAKTAGIPTKDIEEMIKELSDLIQSITDRISKKGANINPRELLEQLLKKRVAADIVLKQLDKAKKAKTDKGQDSVKYTVLGIVAVALLGGLGFIFFVRYKDMQFPGKGHKLGAKKEKKERLKELKKRA